MPLNFLVMGLVALGVYALTYFILRRRLSHVDDLLARLGADDRSSAQSFLLGWVFRGRGTGQERVARLFSVFPPLMFVVAAAGIVFAFFTGIAFLRVATSIGLLVGLVVFALPFYRTADVFDMFILVRVAERAGLNCLSNEDVNMLENARSILSWGISCFRRFSLLVFVSLGVLYAVDPFASMIIISLYPDLSSGLLVFVGVVGAVLVGTYASPKLGSDVAPESGEPREIAMPLAGDHLSYGAVWTLEATRARLMRKFRLPREPDEAEPETQKDGRDSNLQTSDPDKPSVDA